MNSLRRVAVDKSQGVVKRHCFAVVGSGLLCIETNDVLIESEVEKAAAAL